MSSPGSLRSEDGDRRVRPGLRVRAREALRLLAKAGFAAADVLLPEWPGPRLLIYHQVGGGTGRQMDIDPAIFRDHLEWLQQRGRIVRLEDALSERATPESDRLFVLTFDDGYADVYRNAFPMLKEKGVPFTLYLTSGHIESRRPLQPGDDPLSWSQVEEMVGTGLVTVGAHTHSHPDLRQLSPEQVEEEIGTSNDLIERRVGVTPQHFAYPKGYWARVAEPVVRRVYATATLGAGAPVTSSTDLYRVHRVPVQRGDGRWLFRRKLIKGMRMEEWARRVVKGYRHPPAEVRLLWREK